MPEQIMRRWQSLCRNHTASCRKLHFLPSEGMNGVLYVCFVLKKMQKSCKPQRKRISVEYGGWG